MNEIQLECFIKVAETLNFMEAAKQLHISQSAVSKQINSLEVELNTRLFDRTTRTVHLTLVGERFLIDAKRILKQIDTSKNWIHSFRLTAHYSLRIGYTEASELSRISIALKHLHDEYKHIDPIFSHGPVNELLSLLSDGTIDIVFAMDDVKTENSAIMFNTLMDSALVCIVPNGHPLCNDQSILFDDLKEYSQILYLPTHMRSAFFSARNRTASHESTIEIYNVDSFAEVYAMVKAGFGYALIPKCYAKEDKEITIIPIDDSNVHHYGYFYRKKMMYPALQELIRIYQSILNS